MSKINEYRSIDEFLKIEERISQLYEEEKKLWTLLKTKFPLENDRKYCLRGNCLSFTFYDDKL